MEVVAPDEVPALQLGQVELLCGHQVEELAPGQQLHHHDYLPGALENGKSHVVFPLGHLEGLNHPDNPGVAQTRHQADFLVHLANTHCTLHTTHFLLHTSYYYTLLTTHFTLLTSYCALHTANCTLNTIFCTSQFFKLTLYTKHCTAHRTQHCPVHFGLHTVL